MNAFFHSYDLPDDFLPQSVAIDTEAMGLKNYRDRLCLVQLCDDQGNVHLIHFPTPSFNNSPNLLKLLQDKNILKIFHYARFDVALLSYSFNIQINSIYCTKIASKLVRTYTNRHGLKDLCKELLGIELSKQEQTSDWGREKLTPSQKEYATSDVLYLHDLKNKLDSLLKREKREEIANACFQFLPTRTWFDLKAGETYDIFSYITD